MPRLPRYTAPGVVQHVMLRGNNKSVMFVDTADYQHFHDTLVHACEDHGCHVHAYVFMTNHVHLLATPNDSRSFANALQAVGRRYARRFNDTYGRTGHVWGERYKAIAVDTEQYLFSCSRYIELNPVRAGLAAQPLFYPWSSHRANTLGATDKLVTPHERYRALASDARGRQTAYRALFSEQLSDTVLEEIRASMKRSSALGSQRFRDEMAELRRRQTRPEIHQANLRRHDQVAV